MRRRIFSRRRMGTEEANLLGVTDFLAPPPTRPGISWEIKGPGFAIQIAPEPRPDRARQNSGREATAPSLLELPTPAPYARLGARF